MRSRLWWFVPSILVAVGSAAAFLLTTVLMDHSPDVTVVGVPTVIAAVVILAAGGVTHARQALSDNRAAAMEGALGGVLVLWAAPLLALSQRATDAPSGSETLFFTTTAWALLAVTVTAVCGPLRRAALPVAAALAATTGGAALLANWERPSSFSPFVKFPRQEMLMLVAGLLFAVGTLLIARAAARTSPKAVLATAFGAAGAMGLLGMVAGAMAGSAVWALSSTTTLIILGLAYAAYGWGWIQLAAKGGAERASAALFLAPVMVTSLAAVERSRGVYGANPIGWTPAAGAIAVVLLASVALALSGKNPRQVHQGSQPRRTETAIAVVASLGLAAAVVSLALPALAASSRGILAGELFEAEWVMVGFESAIGWLAVAAAALATAAAWSRTAPAFARSTAAISAIVVAGAAFVLRSTPFYTVTRWIPAEVQQAYGTEYARFSVEALSEPVRIAAFALAAASSLALLVVLARGRLRPADVTEEVAT